MKTSKKIIFGLGLLLTSLVLSFLLFGPHKALAYTATSEDQIKNATFSYVDALTINGNIGGQTVTFKTDPNPTYITQIVYKAQDYDCTATISVPADVNRGFSLNDLETNPGKLTSSTQAAVNIDYNPNQTKCTSTNPDNLLRTISNTSAGTAFFTKNTDNTFTNILSNSLFSNPVNNTYFLSSESSCVDRIVVNGSGLTYFELDANKGVSVAGSSLGIGDIGGCKVQRINFIQPSNAAQAVTLSKQFINYVLASSTGAGGGGGSNSTDTTSSSCIDDNTLAWILCPIINGLSKSADKINDYVTGQLNFSVEANLNGSVEKAWTVFRSLASVILVIVMLIMVISQALGGGIFDAYTVRKLLPRLVAAVILMQISWQICVWTIGLANDVGQGIGQLMAAPFGGTNALELGSLLKRLNEAGAVIVGVTTTAAVITAAVFSVALISFGWPIMLLAIILVVVAILVALATLLFRNALIVLLVMLSPLAFLAYVLPGTERYWKIWRDNFTKLLVFFPLVIAIIYAGRIFAWTVAGLGKAGPFDLIMVLVGFFGPYFFLPKTFKYGGNLLSIASKGINESWPVKRGRETAQKGLMGRQQREINKWAKDLDPTRDGYVRRTGGKKFGIIPNFEGSLSKTALWNLRAGRVIPTKRGLASAIQRGETWNSEEDAIAAAKIKREQDKAISEDPDNLKDNPTYTYSLDANGNVKGEVSKNATARGKAAIFNAAGRADPREAGVAAERALKTSSWVEMAKNLVPVLDDSAVNPNGLAARIRASGAEIFEGNPNDKATAGKLFVRMYDTPRYNSKVNSSEDLYPLPLGKYLLATPHISNPENQGLAGNVQKNLQEEENELASREKRPPRAVAPMPHHIARAVETIRGYMDAGNITSQSEAEFGEFGRLAGQDPRVAVEFGKLLERIAGGGQGGINVLTQLNSSASMQGTVKGILEKAPGMVKHTSLEGYLQAGKRSIAGLPDEPDEGNGEMGNGSRGGDDTGGPTTGGTPPQSPSGGGSSPNNVNTRGGNVSYQPTGGGYSAPSGPVELKINHEALADTIREATRQGAKLGTTQAIKDSGLPKSGDVISPDSAPEAGRQQSSASGEIQPEEFNSGGKYPPPNV